jgi:hypothetical protein
LRVAASLPAWNILIEKSRLPTAPDFLFVVSRRASGEAEEPDDIEVAVFVEIANETDVKLAKTREIQIPLVRVLGFRDTAPDHIEQRTSVDGIAEKRAEREQGTPENRPARNSLDVANQKGRIVRLAEVNFEIPPHNPGGKERRGRALGHKRDRLERVAVGG